MSQFMRDENGSNNPMAAKIISWAVYATFVTIALYVNWHPSLFSFDGTLGSLKLVVWSALIAFLFYSVYCSLKENIFRTVPKLAEFHWGRQIGVDLYLGLFVALILIYLNEGFFAVALWALPTLLFANLSVLLYLGIHFDSIATRFIG